MHQARSLLATHDFVALQGTHSTEGRSRMLRLPHRCVPFYSHYDSTRTAGVCIWVKQPLLRQFNPTTIDSWIEVAPGRAAILRLDGPKGSLDICVVYLHSGTARAQRQIIREAILRSLRPKETALTLMAGDWNFVCDTADRFQKRDVTWTGGPDVPEHDQFFQPQRTEVPGTLSG